jgi:hypothetical protein
MSKETLLKEFEDDWNNRRRINLEDMLSFLSQAIDQTREETIMEVEETINKITPPYIGVLESNNDRRIYEAGWGALLEEIKQSLINLRK